MAMTDSTNRLVTRDLARYLQTVAGIKPLPDQEERNQQQSDKDEEKRVQQNFQVIHSCNNLRINPYFGIWCKDTTIFWNMQIKVKLFSKKNARGFLGRLFQHATNVATCFAEIIGGSQKC